jgi:hypothetical protein
MNVDVIVIRVVTNGLDKLAIYADATAGKSTFGGYQGDDNGSSYTKSALMDVGCGSSRNVLNQQLKTYLPLSGVEHHEGLAASIRVSWAGYFLISGQRSG